MLLPITTRSFTFSDMLRMFFIYFSLDEDKTSNRWCEIIRSLDECLDLKTSCGYITLLNIAARKRAKLRQMPNITTLASYDYESECDGDDGLSMKAAESEGSNVEDMKDASKIESASKSGETLSNDGKCAEEISERNDACEKSSSSKDSGLEPLNRDKSLVNGHLFETPPMSPSRDKIPNMTSCDNVSEDQHWVPLHVTYGVPLFDGVLNEEICSKVCCILFFSFRFF